MTKVFVKGEKIMDAVVVKVADFGAFVKLNESTDGLVHVSEMAPFRIENINTFIKVGDKVNVVVKDIDEMKRLKLSIKDIDPTRFKKPEAPKI